MHDGIPGVSDDVTDDVPRTRRGGRVRDGDREAGRQGEGEERGRRRWRRGDELLDADLPSAVL